MQFRLLGRGIALPANRVGIMTAALLSVSALASGAQAQFMELSQQAMAQQRVGSPRSVLQANPGRGVDGGAYLRAVEHREKMRPAAFGGPKLSAGTRGVNIAYTGARWEFFGPYNLQPRYARTQGPTSSFMSGRVNSVAFDNRTQGIFYVAAASGGAWKGDMTTGSLIWTPLGDKFAFPETSSVATDPTNGRILYVGLGDFYGPGSGQGEGQDTPRFNGNATGQGIMKSVNGGTTFVNIGNRDSNGAAIMAGTAVSSIVVHPKNPRIIVASTGRGTNPGSLWRSTDGGATWKKPTLKNGANIPSGDWNTVRIFNPYGRSYPAQSATDPQFMFASLINDGVYRSDDQGATWRKIANTPLNFNVASAGGRKTLIVTPSATDANVIYVMDTSSAYDDGRIYRGQPQNRADVNGSGTLNYLWTEITGNYNTANGQVNNWSRSEYASALVAAPAAFLPPQPPPPPYDGHKTYTLDILYGGNRTLSASLGADRSLTLSLLGEANLWRDTIFSHDGSLPPRDRIHAWQRDLKYDPFDPQVILVANDGGVYQVRYDPDNTAPGFSGTSADHWFTVADLNTSGDISGTSVDVRKQSFGVTQINGADFHATDPNYALAGTQHMGVVRFPTGTTGWTNVGATVSDIAGNPTGVVGNYVGDTAIAGNRQYAWVISGGAGNRIVRTDDNWASVVDITPDQSFTGTNATSFLPETHYPFPYSSPLDVGSTDTSVQSAWAGQTKSAFPIIEVDTNGSTFSGSVNAIYTGTNAIWRYVPPPTRESGADLAGTVTRDGVGGMWKQIGTTTFGGVVTAIAITRGPDSPNPFVKNGQRIYVGTSTGELWMTDDNAREFTPAATTGPSTSNATWRQINNGTLPARPITSISVNPTLSGGAVAHPEDILVTLGGTGGGHIYRAQDTKASTVAFTDQGGLVTNSTDPNFFTRLPDIPVNGVARDSQDPTNTWYVATDIGVFVTTDQGSTWQDATTPLGLPNVQCTAIKYVPGTNYLNVATYGRGLWRIKTNNLAQVYAKPNLVSSFTLNRIGSEVFAVVTVTNVQLKDALGNLVDTGLAENVQITTSSIVRTTGVGTTTTLPVTLGAIAPGTSRSLTLRFPGSAGPSGSAVTFQVGGTYVTQDPTGPVNNNTSFPDVRTRLP